MVCLLAPQNRHHEVRVATPEIINLRFEFGNFGDMCNNHLTLLPVNQR